MPAFFTCVSKKFFVLQNCAAPENELFLRQNVPEKGSNTDVLQALRVRYGGKRAVSQAIYPYRASAYFYITTKYAAFQSFAGPIPPDSFGKNTGKSKNSEGPPEKRRENGF